MKNKKECECNSTSPCFIHFIKHDVSGACLYLVQDTYEDVTINLKHVVSVRYNQQYPNGYGSKLSRLTLDTTNGSFVLYREDADLLYNRLMRVIDGNTEQIL